MTSRTDSAKRPFIASLLAGFAVVAGGAGASFLAPSANAKPPAAAGFCVTYPESKLCHSGFTECATCHTTAPARNLFGVEVADRMAKGQARPLSDSAFLAALPDALKAVENLDADGDGASNLTEILAGTKLADASSAPISLACNAAQASRAKTGRWNVCGYDPEFAFRKVNLDFCGKSPSKAELDAFRKLRGNDTAWRAAMNKTLDTCLSSKYWLGNGGIVWNLANPKVRPAHTIKSGANPGPVPLGDYDDDYNLFSYANSGDRDVRDLMQAQYFVTRVSDDPVKFEIAAEDKVRRSQNVPKEKRVGMLTTRWNAALNTMFTPIPRTNAAQAYRAYLGYDIAKMEGLDPNAHEPDDFDSKGVKDEECAACHRTLDPITYPFTRYNGFFAFNYASERMNGFVRTDGPRVVETPEHGILLGKPVKDLLEWGQVAANSDPFAKKVVLDYWTVLVGRPPEAQPQDNAEYTNLWRGLKDKAVYDYRVEKMLHGLIFTNAYGRP